MALSFDQEEALRRLESQRIQLATAINSGALEISEEGRTVKYKNTPHQLQTLAKIDRDILKLQGTPQRRHAVMVPRPY